MISGQSVLELKGILHATVKCILKAPILWLQCHAPNVWLRWIRFDHNLWDTNGEKFCWQTAKLLPFVFYFYSFLSSKNK